MQRRRIEREGERPVPYYWGHTDLRAYIEFADAVHLDGVAEKITTHGADNRQAGHRPVTSAKRAP